MVLYALPILLTVFIRKHIFRPTSSHFSSMRSSQEYRLFMISKYLMLVYFLYAIVIPIRLDTSFSLVGAIIFIIGFVIYTIAWINMGTSEKGKVFSRGMFRFSRHPVYISSAVVFLGAGLISRSWFYLVLSLLVGISHMRNAFAEEQICLHIFGEEYRQYMTRTPRWFGLPKDSNGLS